jgi:hypothetical protein
MLNNYSSVSVLQKNICIAIWENFVAPGVCDIENMWEVAALTLELCDICVLVFVTDQNISYG